MIELELLFWFSHVDEEQEVTNLIPFKAELYVTDPNRENSLASNSLCGVNISSPSVFVLFQSQQNSLESTDLYFLSKDDTKI